MKLHHTEAARRALSVFMTGFMVFSLIPAQAFAEPAATEAATEAVTTTDGTSAQSEDATTDKDKQATADEPQAAQDEKNAAAATSDQGDGDYGIMTADYADPATDRDITNNLLDPDPEAKFENPVGSGAYYTVDELKAKFGDDYKIYVGDSVWVKFNYKNLKDVKPDEALTFPIPEGLEGNEIDVKGAIKGPDGTEQGRYWLEDGKIHLQFSNEYIEKTGGNVSDGFVNFYGFVDESATSKPGISFGDHVIAAIGGHVAEDPNQKVSVKKWNGTPDSKTETTYDHTKNAEQFTIEVDTTGNTKPVDINVSDVVSFSPANVIDNNKAWTVDTDEAANAGLTTSFTKDSNGKYVWSIKQMPPNTKYKLTYWVYLDAANSTGNFSFTNEATPAIGGQNFTPAKTTGGEEHQFSVSKSAGKITYDPATGKATATYTVSVTANANNTGTANNVSVVDTFKTGGKYVTDVKQTSPDGTISDKKQSGDNYSFKWNIGSMAPGETKTLTYTAEFDANELYFGADQGSKDRKDINNEAKVYEGADTNPRAQASAGQRVDNQQATKGYEFDTKTGALKFTITFNGKIPGTNNYFDSVLTNFTDQILTDGVTYMDTTPVLEAFNDSGTQKTAQLTDANIGGKTSFNIAIPQDMKGAYSYRLTYYVKVPAGIDPSTVIRNKMSAQGVGINGNNPFTLNDEANAKVGDTYANSLSKGVNYAQVLGPEGEYDRIEWNLTVTSPLPAGATITDKASNSDSKYLNVFNNGDMLDPDVTKLCVMNGKNIASTLTRGEDYDLVWNGSEMIVTILRDIDGITKDTPLRLFYRTQIKPTDATFEDLSSTHYPQNGKEYGTNGMGYERAENKATLDVNGLTATASNATTINGAFEKYNGSYDSSSREIQWKLGLYYNSHNGYIIQGKRTITEHISPDQVISRVTDPNGNEIPYTVSEDGRTVTFQVDWRENDANDYCYVYTKLSEQYLIEHGKDPDNLVDYEVTNSASIDAYGTQVSAGSKATVNETGTLTKDYKYTNLTEQNEGGIEFTLNVNPNGSDLDPKSDTITVKDTMNRNLVLDPESVRINGQKVADFGQGAELKFDKNSNHFDLVLPDGVACKVTYVAKIVGVVAGEDGWLSNTATIDGRPGEATVDKTEIKRLEVGAGAFSAVPFFVKKLDQGDNMVSGAAFEIKRVELQNGQLTEVDAIDSTGDVITTSNDNLDGTYRWLNLIPTTPAVMGGKGYVYVVRETVAPTGCKLDDTPKYIAFAEPSDEMKQALADAGATLEMVHGGGGNNVGTMFSVKDENLNDTVSVKANKVWNDNDNSEGFRPSEITVNLIKDYDVDNPAQTVTVTPAADGSWSYEFKDLPKYETVGSTRKEVTYTVTENEVPEYRTFVSGDAKDGFTITNTHDVATTTIQGAKYWNDNSNASGYRPEQLELGIYADDATEPVRTVTLTPANASAADPSYWIFTEVGLPKYKNDGQRTPIKYTVKEIGAVQGYDLEENGTAANNYTVRNNYDGSHPVVINKVDENGNPVPDAELTLQKITSGTDQGGDGGDTEPIEPESLLPVASRAANLLFELGPGESLSDYMSWITTTEENASKSLMLKPGKYLLSETVTPDGYGTANPIEFEVAEDGTVTILNGAGTVSSTKPYTITMVDARTTSVSVSKTWSDDDNRDGVRPQSVTVSLLADGQATGEVRTLNEDNGWSATFDNLDEFANGTRISYTVVEGMADADKANYTSTIEPTDAATDGAHYAYSITNAHTTAKASVSGTKVWDDNNNQDGKRPSSVTLAVYDADDMTTAVQTATVDATTVDANDANVWHYEFTGLLKNKQVDGQTVEITYVVRELDANNGAIDNDGTNGEYTVTYDAATNTVTNKHVPEKISISGTKTWEDAGNQDGVRPDNITVKLMKGKEVVATQRVTGGSTESTWSYSFTDLPKYEGGQEINYTISEETVEGYQATYSGNNITNTHTISQVAVNVTKDWKDDSNRDGVRPQSVTVSLLADGQATGEVRTLNEDNGWSAAFENLDEFANGTRISYTVVEGMGDADKANYQSDITPADNGIDGAHYAYTVTNTHKPALTSVKVTKDWNDRENKEGKRPDSITVALLANDVATGKVVTLSEDNNWTASFDGLYVNENGQPITYTVSEEQVDQYNEPVITGDAANGFTITNNETARKVTINKVDAKGNPLSGAELMVEKVNATDPDQGGDQGGDGGDTEPPIEIESLDDGSTTTIDTWTTDGTAHDLQLKPGKYVLSEANAPAGYDKAEPIEFTVNDDGTVTGPEGIVSGDDLNVVTMTDELTSFDVNVLKVDDKNNALVGAKLTVSGTDAIGREIEPISWTSGTTAEAMSLTMGTYTLHEESAPKGYLTIKDVTFKVDESGKVTITDAASEKVVVKDGNTIVATDKTEPAKPTPATSGNNTAGHKLAATGDATKVALPAGLGVAGALLVAFAVIRKRQGRGEK